MIFLVESFYSFQGEGRFIGTPSIFIRLGGCNLECKGFGVKYRGVLGCDSIRAVNRDLFLKDWQKVENLSLVIDKHLKDLKFKPDIVITGGEPLIYYKNSILIEMLEEFIQKGHKVTIETNTTIEIEFIKFPIYKEVIFAMGIKLKNSGEKRSKRINKDAIKAIVENTKDSFFKFVLSSKDLQTTEIEEITKEYKNIPIYCMPMGSSADELKKNDKDVAIFCMQNGYNFTDRTHIRLWNNEKGR